MRHASPLLVLRCACMHTAGLTYWAPNINIFRCERERVCVCVHADAPQPYFLATTSDPRWGRGQETPGEDPYLSAFYAREFVQGMQEGDDPAHLKVSACCKHYAAYRCADFTQRWPHAIPLTALLRWAQLGGMGWAGPVSLQCGGEQAGRGRHIPARLPCLRAGGPRQQHHVLLQRGVPALPPARRPRHAHTGCMRAQVNGVPSCANHWLLTTMARDRWGFDGYITSDCGAVVGVYDAHHYTATPAETCAATLRAGVDIDCGYFMCANLAAALQQGVVTDRDVHEALRNLLRVRFRLGEFDPARGQPYLHIHTDQLNSRRHRLLALQAARESIVLLRNSGALPLGDRGRATLAVVGPHADATVAMQGAAAQGCTRTHKSRCAQ